jgi:hypothetical protein
MLVLTPALRTRPLDYRQYGAEEMTAVNAVWVLVRLPKLWPRGSRGRSSQALAWAQAQVQAQAQAQVQGTAGLTVIHSGVEKRRAVSRVQRQVGKPDQRLGPRRGSRQVEIWNRCCCSFRTVAAALLRWPRRIEREGGTAKEGEEASERNRKESARVDAQISGAE